MAAKQRQPRCQESLATTDEQRFNRRFTEGLIHQPVGDLIKERQGIHRSAWGGFNPPRRWVWIFSHAETYRPLPKRGKVELLLFAEPGLMVGMLSDIVTASLSSSDVDF
ncbi:MAG: hypothetical protein O7I42_14695 [Alphaproteobacteria bacterium]|nr:hypothetical protein [Alphaproteobacteria bacterium]